MAKRKKSAKSLCDVDFAYLKVDQLPCCCGIGELSGWDDVHIRLKDIEEPDMYEDYEQWTNWCEGRGKYNADKKVKTRDFVRGLQSEIQALFEGYGGLITTITDEQKYANKIILSLKRLGFKEVMATKSNHGNYKIHTMVISKDAWNKKGRKLKV